VTYVTLDDLFAKVERMFGTTPGLSPGRLSAMRSSSSRGLR
jgi:hypothetical protein